MHTLSCRHIAAALLAVTGICAQAQSLEGRVINVSSGDTLTLIDIAKNRHTIRLTGIDAPDPNKAFAKESRNHLSRLTLNKNVSAECINADKHGRAVCKVMTNGTDISLSQLQAGYAWYMQRFQYELEPADRVTYATTQSYARAQRKGLWRRATHTPLEGSRHPDKSLYF